MTRLMWCGLLLAATATAASQGNATSGANGQGRTPELKEPEAIVETLLTSDDKKKAEDTFRKGYTYYIWRGPGDFPVGQDAPKNVLLIPFFYVAKAKPLPFQVEIVLETSQPGSKQPNTLVTSRQSFEYRSAGQSAALYVDLEKTLAGLAGSHKARIRLLDFDTGKKPISNEIYLQVIFPFGR
jgi:hypothetical protein